MRDFIEKKWFLLVWFLFLCLCLFVSNVKAEDIELSSSSTYYYMGVGTSLATQQPDYSYRPNNTFDISTTYQGTFSQLGYQNPMYIPSANYPVSTGSVLFGSVRDLDFTISGISPTLKNGSSYKLVVRIFNSSSNTITNNLNYPNLMCNYNNNWYTTCFSNINSSYSYDQVSGILTITVLFTMNHDSAGFFYQLNSSSSGYNGQGHGQFVWNSLEINNAQFTLRSVNLYLVSGDSGSDVIINQNNTIINQNSTQINQNDTIIQQNQTQITQQQSTNEKLDQIEQTITNDNTTQASNSASSYFSNFSNNTHGLTGIITLPLSTIQSLTSATCSPLVIPIPYTNSSISLPCMSVIYNTYVPSIYNLWKIVSFGIIAYFICLDIFRMVKNFKDPNKDEIEVLDL